VHPQDTVPIPVVKLHHWIFDCVPVVSAIFWFRYFHLALHKYINIAGKDPELDSYEKPNNRGTGLHHLSTVDYWWAKVTTLIGNSIRPLTAVHIPPRKRQALRVEAVLLIGAYIFFTLIPITLLWL
jgi:fatty acid desaturase